MADIPKPLPRTRIGAKPVRILSGYENNPIQTLDDSSLSQHLSNHRDSDPVTIIQIEEPPLNTNDGNQEENVSPKVEVLSEQIVEEHSENGDRSHTDIDLNSSSSNKEIDGYPSIVPNDKDTSTNDDENIINDDDDVIDEILKCKSSSTHDKKKNLEDKIHSFEKNNPSATKNEKEIKLHPNDSTETLLGIHIHRSDCLKMDHIIRHPSVMVHIVDSQNGAYLPKSKPNKNVTYNQEQSSSILPVMTRPYNFKDHKCIIPEWEETLTFNETTAYVIKSSTIFFFEIVDFVDSSHTDDEYASVGWHRIAWAFLKPLGSNSSLNVEKTLRLQLYYASSKSSKVSSVNIPCVYEWYKKKRFNPYPSTLFVTLKNVSFENIDSKPQQRSCTPFQTEIGSDASVKSLAMFSSDCEEIPDTRLDNSSAIYRLGDMEWSRLPGQSCKIPNSKISTLHPDSKGCLAVKFSNSGIFLACGTSSEVFIYAIDGVIEKRLTSHQGLIYTLCWFTDDSLLLSASADCTACIWDTQSAIVNPLQILPHPSFVYCSTFLFPERVILTGSYDGVVRIWYQTHVVSKVWQLHQELAGHEGFVNALCSFRNKEFFSGDSHGVIIHWAFDECGKWNSINEIRLPEIQGIIINKLMVFPGDKRLLIHTRDSLLRTVDVKTTVTIQWYQGGLNDSFQCNSIITPCGSLVFATSEDGTVNVWESNTGKQVAFYSGNFISGCGGTVDYHPYDNIAVFSFYSSKNVSSSVYLLKYSMSHFFNDIDIALYILNESTYYSQRHDTLSTSSVSGEENDSNHGKSKMKKKRYLPFRY